MSSTCNNEMFSGALAEYAKSIMRKFWPGVALSAGMSLLLEKRVDDTTTNFGKNQMPDL